MNKIYILGDCHTCYFNYKNVIEDDISLKEQYYGIEFNFISRIAMSIYRINYSEYGKIEDFDKNGIIMPALGEMDVRFNLNRHNNADSLAKEYILKTMKYFPEHKIRFIEPILESSDDVAMNHLIDNAVPNGLSKIIHSYADIESRVNQYNLLVKSLRKYSYQYGLLEPINLIDEVFKSNVLTKEHAIGIHVNKEYAKKIIDLIVEKSFNVDLKGYNV